MLLQILTYTHRLTTMLFGIFLSAFFLGVKQNKKNVCILLGGGAVSGLFFLICNTVFGSLFTEADFRASAAFSAAGVLLPFPLAAFHNLYHDRLSVLPVQQLGRYFCLIPERIGLDLLSSKDYRDCCRFRFLKPVSVPDYRTAFGKI